MGQTWQINEPIGGQGKMPPNPYGATAQNSPFGLRGGANTMNQLPMGLNAGLPQGGFGNVAPPQGRRNKLQPLYGKAY